MLQSAKLHIGTNLYLLTSRNAINSKPVFIFVADEIFANITNESGLFSKLFFISIYL